MTLSSCLPVLVKHSSGRQTPGGGGSCSIQNCLGANWQNGKQTQGRPDKICSCPVSFPPARKQTLSPTHVGAHYVFHECRYNFNLTWWIKTMLLFFCPYLMRSVSLTYQWLESTPAVTVWEGRCTKDRWSVYHRASRPFCIHILIWHTGISGFPFHPNSLFGQWKETRARTRTARDGEDMQTSDRTASMPTNEFTPMTFFVAVIKNPARPIRNPFLGVELYVITATMLLLIV